MNSIPIDVGAFIVRRFAVAEQPTALDVLTAATLGDDSPPSARLIRCAAIASRGSIERLRYFVNLMRVDFRDVIVAAEYEEQNGNLSKVRDLNNAIADDA